MRGILWTLCFVGLALWTLVAWATAGLIGNADAWVPPPGVDPLAVGLAADWANWLGSAGTTVAFAIWAAGALALLAVTFILSRVFRLGGKFVRGGRGRHALRLPPQHTSPRAGLLDRLRAVRR